MPIRKGGKYGYRFERPRTSRAGLTRRPPRKTGIPKGKAKFYRSARKRYTIGNPFSLPKKRKRKRIVFKPKKIRFYGRR